MSRGEKLLLIDRIHFVGYGNGKYLTSIVLLPPHIFANQCLLISHIYRVKCNELENELMV